MFFFVIIIIINSTNNLLIALRKLEYHLSYLRNEETKVKSFTCFRSLSLSWDKEFFSDRVSSKRRRMRSSSAFRLFFSSRVDIFSRKWAWKETKWIRPEKELLNCFNYKVTGINRREWTFNAETKNSNSIILQIMRLNAFLFIKQVLK